VRRLLSIHTRPVRGARHICARGGVLVNPFQSTRALLGARDQRAYQSVKWTCAVSIHTRPVRGARPVNGRAGSFTLDVSIHTRPVRGARPMSVASGSSSASCFNPHAPC